jgi:hypothetical protein
MSDGYFVASVACVCVVLGWVVLFVHSNHVHRERMERLEKREFMAFWHEEVD